MEITFKLHEAANTWNPVLHLLHEKGYLVWREFRQGEEGSEWYARKGSREFSAFGPLQLFALVSMWEQLGDNWRDAPYEDWYGRILAEASIEGADG